MYTFRLQNTINNKFIINVSENINAMDFRTMWNYFASYEHENDEIIWKDGLLNNSL